MDDINDQKRIKVLEVEDPNIQESLQTENIPDLMDAEQTWPTEEELKEAEQQTVNTTHILSNL